MSQRNLFRRLLSLIAPKALFALKVEDLFSDDRTFHKAMRSLVCYALLVVKRYAQAIAREAHRQSRTALRAAQ
jgi:hypothetical protein